MKSTLLFMSLISASILFASADSLNVDLTEEMMQEIYFQQYADSVNSSYTFQTGNVSLLNGAVSLDVPTGYKYLDAEQSEHVLTEVWGNPPSSTMGLLFPENSHPISDEDTYAVEINFINDGYVSDEDATDINYSELADEIKDDSKEWNKERIAQGYEPIEFVGWASSPFYDQQNKKLHWAKELKFGDDEENTLNYEIRILGRKGYLDMNALGNITVLPQFKQDIDVVLSSINFNEGHRYEDFDSNIDKVAAYGIGGLIAGKVLAKVGFFAVIAKFGKFIIIGIVGFFAVFKKRLFGKKETNKELKE